MQTVRGEQPSTELHKANNSQERRATGSTTADVESESQVHYDALEKLAAEEAKEAGEVYPPPKKDDSRHQPRKESRPINSPLQRGLSYKDILTNREPLSDEAHVGQFVDTYHGVAVGGRQHPDRTVVNIETDYEQHPLHILANQDGTPASEPSKTASPGVFSPSHNPPLSPHALQAQANEEKVRADTQKRSSQRDLHPLSTSGIRTVIDSAAQTIASAASTVAKTFTNPDQEVAAMDIEPTVGLPTPPEAQTPERTPQARPHQTQQPMGENNPKQQSWFSRMAAFLGFNNAKLEDAHMTAK